MTLVRRCLVVTLLVLAAAPVSRAGAAPGSEASCQGHTATIVGSPSMDLVRGTPGDDVIVSGGAGGVLARGGDDLVCMTGRSPVVDDFFAAPYVDGGPGDDEVTASYGRESLLLVSLGAGADTFDGGRESDFVSGGNLAEVFGDEQPIDSDPDVIDTGSGQDLVVVGDGGPLADEVRVASPGAQVRAYTGSLAGSGSLTGGPRSSLALIDGADGGWALDLAAGTAVRGAADPVSWSGFGRFTWAVPGTLDVHGSSAAETVIGPVVSGDLGAGDDTVVVWSSSTDRASHRPGLAGGSGTDRLKLFAGALSDGDGPGEGFVPFTPADVTVEVPRQRARFGDGESIGLAGFEWYGAQTDGAATLLGSSADDVLYGSACDLRMRGGAGDDALREEPNIGSAGFSEPACTDRQTTRLLGGPGDDTATASSRSVLVGGPGDDHLRGGYGRDRLSGGGGDDRLSGDGRADLLTGGTGVDVADGGRGDDTCHAEYGSECELPESAAHLTPPPPGPRPSSARFADPAGDVLRREAPHWHATTPAPDQAVGDVIAVRTTYRHGQVTIATRFRSLDTSDVVVIDHDIQYGSPAQYRYGDTRVTLRPGGAVTGTADFEGRHCRPRVSIDDATATVVLAVDAVCLDHAPWVRAIVHSFTVDDPKSPTSSTQDDAPDQHGRDGRYGPRIWGR